MQRKKAARAKLKNFSSKQRLRKAGEDSVLIGCPYCAESFRLPVDKGNGDSQTFVYDCAVCCRPILVKLTVDDDGVISGYGEAE